MQLSKKRYENRKVFDPSLLRHKIQFSQMVATDNGSGGTTVGYPLILETKAFREQINAYDQIAFQLGATPINQDCYFTIRARKSFIPEKDMRVVVNGEKYTIAGFVPLNDPITYWKILCRKADWND